MLVEGRGGDTRLGGDGGQGQGVRALVVDQVQGVADDGGGGESYAGHQTVQVLLVVSAVVSVAVSPISVRNGSSASAVACGNSAIG